MVTPGAESTDAPRNNAAGPLPVKPWDFPVTVAIPNWGPATSLLWVIRLLRLQTVNPYILIIDTGSPTFGALDVLRDEATEVHYIRAHAWRHPCEPVCAAMDVAFALCRTEHLFCTHSDCFPRRPDLLGWHLSQCSPSSPVVGYQMSDRSWINAEWEGMVSHTATMLHMPSMRAGGVSWSLDRWYHDKDLGSPFVGPGWIDTEVCFNYRLKDAGIRPTFVGRETHYSRLTDRNIDHVRSITSHQFIDISEHHRRRINEWAGDAMGEAEARVKAWTAQKEGAAKSG
jgi:hypothetical protein